MLKGQPPPGRAGGRPFHLFCMGPLRNIVSSKRSVPVRPYPVGQWRPHGSWFHATASDARLGIRGAVRPAPARPVPIAARPAWSAGRPAAQPPFARWQGVASMAALKGGIGVGAIVPSRKRVSVVRGPPAAARRLAHGPTVASPIARRCPHAARRAVAAVLGGHKLGIGSKCPGPMARAVKAGARPPAAGAARQPAEPPRPPPRAPRDAGVRVPPRGARGARELRGGGPAG